LLIYSHYNQNIHNQHIKNVGFFNEVIYTQEQKSGPRIDPLGTPDVISAQLDETLFMELFVSRILFGIFP
jgi:hypothetical protein